MGLRTVQERWRVVFGLVLFFALTYYPLGYLRNPTDGHALKTLMDDWIPVWPIFGLIYWTIIPYIFFTAFKNSTDREFRKLCYAHGMAIGIAAVIFVVFPVTSQGLRVPTGQLDPSRFADSVLLFLYFADPPLNLFPSLHVAWVVINLNARRTVWMAVWGLLLVVSVLVTKQHYVVDAVAGLLLGLCAIYSARLLSSRIRPLFE